MADVSDVDMLLRYSKLIEHGGLLVDKVDLLVHVSLPPTDVLTRYARFIRHREPLARKVDEIIRNALAQGEIVQDSLGAVGSGDVLPPDHVNTSTDSNTAASEGLAHLDIELGSLTAANGRADPLSYRVNASQDMNTAVDEAPPCPDTGLDCSTAVKSGIDPGIEHNNTSQNFHASVSKAIATSEAEIDYDSANTVTVLNNAFSEATVRSNLKVHSTAFDTSAPLDTNSSDAVVVERKNTPSVTSAALRQAMSEAVSSPGLALDNDLPNISVRSHSASSKFPLEPIMLILEHLLIPVQL